MRWPEGQFMIGEVRGSLRQLEHRTKVSSSNSLVSDSSCKLCIFLSTSKRSRSMDCRSRAISTILLQMSGIVSWMWRNDGSEHSDGKFKLDLKSPKSSSGPQIYSVPGQKKVFFETPCRKMPLSCILLIFHFFLRYLWGWKRGWGWFCFAAFESRQ